MRKIISKGYSSNGKDQPLINRSIRAREVRLIGDTGENYGVIATAKALQMAEEKDLDLVVISPNQEPPVAKIMNYGKFKYEIGRAHV